MVQTVKESVCNAGDLGSPWVRKIQWRREWLFTPVFLSGEFHGLRRLVGYSPWGRKELDMTERLIHTCTGMSRNKIIRYSSIVQASPKS